MLPLRRNSVDWICFAFRGASHRGSDSSTEQRTILASDDGDSWSSSAKKHSMAMTPAAAATAHHEGSLATPFRVHWMRTATVWRHYVPLVQTQNIESKGPMTRSPVARLTCGVGRPFCGWRKGEPSEQFWGWMQVRWNCESSWRSSNATKIHRWDSEWVVGRGGVVQMSFIHESRPWGKAESEWWVLNENAVGSEWRGKSYTMHLEEEIAKCLQTFSLPTIESIEEMHEIILPNLAALVG